MNNLHNIERSCVRAVNGHRQTTQPNGATPMTRTQTIEDFAGADMFDIRDVIARFEELESERETCGGEKEWSETEESEEYTTLKEFLESVEGYGGDEQWRGSWYPLTFIRDGYFENYARELAEDLGAVDRNAAWPVCHVDWEAAAHALKMDYSSTHFEGNEYWYR